MTHEPIPNTTLTVSRLCLGLGDLGTRLTGAPATSLLAAFLAAGGNFVDTAHCYGFWGAGGIGASERELGRVIRELDCRAELVIATKGGHPAADPDYPRPDGYLSPEVLASDIAESRERLGVEAIDLYLLHRDDTRVPAGEIIDALNTHIATGEIRYLGASNWSTDRIAAANAYAAAHGLRGFAVSQIQFSLATPDWPVTDDPTMRRMTAEIAAWHTQTSLPVMAYSASTGGFFAGRDGGYATSENLARRERARSLAGELGVTPAQIALAYLLNQPFPVIPIIGTLDEAHLAESLAAASIPLTPEQVAFLHQ